MIGVGSGSATLQYLKFSPVMSDLSISQMKPITSRTKKNPKISIKLGLPLWIGLEMKQL